MTFAIALSLLVAVFVSVGPTAHTVVEAAPIDEATKYIPITPTRVLNTSDDGQSTLGANDDITIAPITAAVAAMAGVDAADVQAVAINLTVGPSSSTCGPDSSPPSVWFSSGC